MVGYSKEDKELSSQDYMVAGAIAGIVTRFLCQPLDVVKIRFQLQVEPIWGGAESSKYRFTIQAARVIFKEEGIRGLWKGHNPGQLLSILYGIGSFGSFEKFTEISGKYLGLEKSSQLHFVCGSLSGVVGIVLSYPFDVIRTRFIAQGNNLVYKTMFGGVKHMLINEGPLALFKGITPTLLQVAPHSGAQFAFYNFFSGLANKISLVQDGDSKLNIYGSMVSGSLAGLFAKTIVYPFDLARKRLEFQGFQQARTGYGQNFLCQGMINCFTKTYREEGYSSLFKGLSPSLLKAVITSGLHFAVYEEAVKAIASYNESNKKIEGNL